MTTDLIDLLRWDDTRYASTFTTGSVVAAAVAVLRDVVRRGHGPVQQNKTTLMTDAEVNKMSTPFRCSFKNKLTKNRETRLQPLFDQSTKTIEIQVPYDSLALRGSSPSLASVPLSLR